MMSIIAQFGMKAVWLAALVVFLVVEGVVPGLVSIWFALGALAALISSFFSAPFWLQTVWFIVVSVASLCLTRPLAKKYVNSKVKPTNADAVIGRECIVTEDVDNILAKGKVSVSGQVWTARSDSDSVVICAGERAEVLRIEGVKLIIRKKQEKE